MDTVPPEVRSRIMAAIRGKNTRPELAVRRLLHAMGFRFRLHVRGMPGTPDIVLPRHGLVVFVHGCFWHRHTGCRGGRVPASNQGFWGPKLAGNVARDRANQRALRRLGWRVAVVWECRVRDLPALRRRFRRLLEAR
jgi:DNA mismatch endonuclease (patch repair protein)